jgi:hypothetical protein
LALFVDSIARRVTRQPKRVLLFRVVLTSASWCLCIWDRLLSRLAYWFVDVLRMQIAAWYLYIHNSPWIIERRSYCHSLWLCCEGHRIEKLFLPWNLLSLLHQPK